MKLSQQQRGKRMPTLRRLGSQAGVTIEPAYPFLSKGSLGSAYTAMWSDAVLRSSFILTFSIFFLLVLLLVTTLAKLPPAMPLLYSLPWGNDQLVPLRVFIIAPLALVVMFLVHLLLLIRLAKQYRVLLRLLFFANTLGAVLLLITRVKIVFLMIG